MRANLIFLCVWAGLAGAGLYLVNHWHDKTAGSEKAKLTLRHDSEIKGLQDELSLKEQDLRLKTREAAARRRAEYETALGGPVLAAFKNPDFSLREALQRVAQACAPSNVLARADVDRFTEFTVTMTSETPLSTNQMIAVARHLLPVAREYLGSLRFSAGGKLIAELDRDDIEFVEDWTRTPDQRLATLLGWEVSARIAEDPRAIEQLRQEQRMSAAFAAHPGLQEKAANAVTSFRQKLQDSYKELTQALEGVAKSAAFDQARFMRDLDRGERMLREAVEHTKKARAFWSDPLSEWKKELETAGVGGDMGELFVQGYSGMFRYDAGRTAKLFEALDGEIISCEQLLRMLQREGDKWKFASGGGLVMMDEGFAKRFEKARLQAREDSIATESALHAWNEAVGDFGAA